MMSFHSGESIFIALTRAKWHHIGRLLTVYGIPYGQVTLHLWIKFWNWDRNGPWNAFFVIFLFLTNSVTHDTFVTGGHHQPTTSTTTVTSTTTRTRTTKMVSPLRVFFFFLETFYWFLFSLPWLPWWLVYHDHNHDHDHRDYHDHDHDNGDDEGEGDGKPPLGIFFLFLLTF